MLPEIGATELMVIAAVALIVVGPKDLPALLRKVGQFVGRLRSLANDFRSSFDEMARQSELDDLRKEVAAMRAGQYEPANPISDTSVFDDIKAELEDDRSWDPATYADSPYDPNHGGDYYSPDAAPEEQVKPKRARKPKTTIAVVEPPPAPARKAAVRKAPVATKAAPAKAAAAKVPARKPAAKTPRAKA